MTVDPLFADSSVGWKLALTALFVLLNGFFVAAEFALVKVRPSHIDALANSGSRPAGVVRTMLRRLDLHLSGCQLGITISSLVLGWLAEPAVAVLLIQGAAQVGWNVSSQAWLHPAALVLALAIVTMLHMVIGEQAPKVWSIHQAKRVSMLCAYPLRGFVLLFSPLIWVINSASNGLLRLFGIAPLGEHEGHFNLAELRNILKTSASAGEITNRQKVLGENILGLAELEVRHVMVPRVDVAFLSTANSNDDNIAIVKLCGHSRLPVGDPDLDQVVGLFYTRDLLRQLLDNRQPEVAASARPLPTVPDTQPLSRLIIDLQRYQIHCALVVDEHGTTVGMVFLEDALEEIVGPIHDEFDERVALVERVSEATVELAGSVPLPDAAGVLGVTLDDDEDTIGGLVVARLGRLPEENDTVEIGPYRATVVSMSRRRVSRVRFERGGDK